MSTASQALYRFYDAAGVLLYVGITHSPAQRWRAHKRRDWWHDVATITIEAHPDRASVLAAEQAAIVVEQPLHNVIHNRRPVVVRRPAPVPVDDEALTPAEVRQIQTALANPRHWGRVIA